MRWDHRCRRLAAIGSPVGVGADGLSVARQPPPRLDALHAERGHELDGCQENGQPRLIEGPGVVEAMCAQLEVIPAPGRDRRP